MGVFCPLLFYEGVNPTYKKREVEKEMVRKAPKATRAGIRKMLANPRTPPQLKAYWRKRLKAMS